VGGAAQKVSLRGKKLVPALASLTLASSLLIGCGGAGSGSAIGEGLDLPVPAPRWPIEWRSNDTVVFQTWGGTATATLDGKVVESREPTTSPHTRLHRQLVYESTQA